ncbi:hypothetical protein Cni_G13598 [Canna indica]|uniref:Uncharacterized protein n=1 Tax=Canna indica TaxID=4628 RepID=A0AAQ3QCV4_9LILI|nr:hypothetical protein Cni_G13598 [Canna indica]
MEPAKSDESPALLMELSIQTIRFLSRSILLLSTLSDHPLFATLAATSLLVALYLPRALLPFLLSPVPISTFLLLAALLRVGSSQSESPAFSAASGGEEEITNTEAKVEFSGYNQNVAFCDSNYIDYVRRSGPLEIIYEEYEGDEEDECGSGGSQEYPRWRQNADLGSGRTDSLRFSSTDSESESDSSSSATSEVKGSSSPEEIRLPWEEDEEGDDMIEILLDEEDNLIEIDISGGR